MPTLYKHVHYKEVSEARLILHVTLKEHFHCRHKHPICMVNYGRKQVIIQCFPVGSWRAKWGLLALKPKKTDNMLSINNKKQNHTMKNSTPQGPVATTSTCYLAQHS
ncbi:hypothetical protein XENOCAPTIV_005333 [Xenoophorus captivus]|uniref:Uncharacterized protein n=1 Tax=Xenoophorus captivus TaxID=1517983 RepID=A0ABV0Q863_9TELE